MEGNKDEAARCIELAESALLQKDPQKALKLIRIAKRLDPTIRAGALSAACESFSADVPLPQREIASEPPAVANSCSYTEEHVKTIREIKRSRDFYSVLGVERNCSGEEIRKAYKKLSLKVHPDKNKAPGADEAFKIVGKAFKCLSDDRSRRNYDRKGSGSVEGFEFDPLNNNVRRRQRTRRYDFSEENFDPDEIFRSFFYGSQSERVYRARAARAQPQREQSVDAGGLNWMILLQLVLIVCFFAFASFPFETHYLLHKRDGYQIPMVTEKRGVEYYVKSSDFDHKFPKGSQARYKVENNVERDYWSALGRYCHMEMQRRRWAKDYPTPHCDKLRSFRVASMH